MTVNEHTFPGNYDIYENIANNILKHTDFSNNDIFSQKEIYVLILPKLSTSELTKNSSFCLFVIIFGITKVKLKLRNPTPQCFYIKNFLRS